MILKFLGNAITLSSLLVPTVARAEWVEVATSTHGDRIYINDSTIDRAGSYVTFGVVGESIGNRVAMILTANCATGQFQKQDVVENGTQIHSATGQFPVQQATMGTLYGAAVQFACGNH